MSHMDMEAATAKRERKPRGLGHERRGEILAAAKELFVAEGYETVTTRKLAERAGISQTGLYVYFKNKEEILEALCESTFELLTGALRTVAAETEPGPEQVRQMMHGYIAFGLEHPDEYQITFMVSHGAMHKGKPKDFSLPREQQPTGIDAFLCFRDQIEKVREAGYIPIDATLATQIAWTALHGLVALFIAHPEFPWVERRVLIDTMVETLVTGLLKPADARQR